MNNKPLSPQTKSQAKRVAQSADRPEMVLKELESESRKMYEGKFKRLYVGPG
ncbi:MAG: hypothetical protein SFW36_19890 [Leptolyngbyaceae cyanobacterium bins.59]|nr:hypothetical protein [Leptolyngbyaceae cyanobacterium bins.59]